MTMQGPGRPALVPFQAGLRPKAGEAAGTMWWDNVPEGMHLLFLSSIQIAPMSMSNVDIDVDAALSLALVVG